MVALCFEKIRLPVGVRNIETPPCTDVGICPRLTRLASIASLASGQPVGQRAASSASFSEGSHSHLRLLSSGTPMQNVFLSSVESQMARKRPEYAGKKIESLDVTEVFPWSVCGDSTHTQKIVDSLESSEFLIWPAKSTSLVWNHWQVMTLTVAQRSVPLLLTINIKGQQAASAPCVCILAK